MPQPIELALFPSCFGAIDWSPDGELAVAAGDQVQILVRQNLQIAFILRDLHPNRHGRPPTKTTRKQIGPMAGT